MGTTTLEQLRPHEGGQAGFETPSSQGIKADRIGLKEPELKAAVLAPLADGHYRFRTLPRLERKSFAIKLRLPQAMPESDNYESMYRLYRRWLDRQIAQKKIDKSELRNQTEKLIEADLAVRDAIGKYRIVFTRVRNAREAAFVTDSRVVADYIRMRMRRGDFPEIYEETRPLELRLNGKQIRVQGASEADQRAIADFLAEHSRFIDPDIEDVL